MDDKKHNNSDNDNKISKREDIEELSNIFDFYSDNFENEEEIIHHTDSTDSSSDTLLNNENNNKDLIENTKNSENSDILENINSNIKNDNKVENIASIKDKENIEKEVEEETDELAGLDDFDKDVANKYAYAIAREDVSVDSEMEDSIDKSLEEDFESDEMYQNKIKPFVESKVYDKAKESLYKSLLHSAENLVDVEDRDVEERAFYAALFLSGKPVEIKTFLKMFTTINLENRLLGYVEKFNKLNLGLRIIHVSGGYQIVTDSEVSTFLDSYFGEKAETLSKASLETVSIIAYKQPITKAEIEDLRGVISSGPMKYLLDRNLIRVVGRKDVPGKPLLYATTNTFLEYFGLNSLSDLPTFREWMELKNNQ